MAKKVFYDDYEMDKLTPAKQTFDPQQILDAMVDLNEASPDPNHILTVKGLRDAVNPIKIGELFGMEVWADPLLPPDVDFFITKERIK